MFLKKAKEISSHVSFRLAAMYLSFVLLVFLITFSVFYHIAEVFLIQRDQNEISVKILRIEEILEKEGEVGLKNYLASERFLNSSKKFFIYIDQADSIFFSHDFPEVNRFNSETIAGKIKNQKSVGWYYIPSANNDEDALEVKKIVVGKFQIHIGASTDERDELLEKFINIFVIIFTPVLAVLIWGSFFITNKMLNPLKKLSSTMEDVEKGRLESRIESGVWNDEFYKISNTFNSMLDQIQSLIQAINSTLDNVAHDLKTPIMQIRIGAELAIRSDLREKYIESNQTAMEACDHLVTLINSIMMQSRVESGAEKLKKKLFDVSSIIKEVEELYFFIAEEKNIKIVIESDLFLINADLIYFKQVIANLVDNAIKYSPENSEIKIKSYIDNLSKELIVAVEDTGFGIEEKDIHKIWERLYRAENSRHELGFGLGLTIVKSIVEAHGGKIEVESRINSGSIFRVKFPLVI